MDKTYFDRTKPKLNASPYKIFVNQAGYHEASAKTAVMTFPTDSFEIRDGAGNIKYCGKTAYHGFDELSGDEIYTADFSDFQEAGSYRIFSGGEGSAPFAIDEDCLKKVFDDTTKAFYYLRCGCSLDREHAGEYAHGKCHDETALLWNDRNVKLNVSGGWHDAGDYGRYVTAGACALAHLLYAYRLYPTAFDKQNLNIPESGGTLPDILSECKYELMWLMKMQDSEGGAYHKATTKCHAPFVMPEEDREEMFVFPVSSFATADLCAVTALASYIYEPFDKSFSSELYNTALKAWSWLEAHPEFIGFQNPDGCNTGGYGEGGDKDNRFWAAAEMYNLTGDKKYHEKLRELLSEDFPLTALGYGSIGGLGTLSYLLTDKEKDETLTESFRNEFRNHTYYLKELSERSGYGAAMSEQLYGWGSNMSLMKNAMLFLITDYLFDSKEFTPYAEKQLDVLLGTNPLGISYVTGNGEYRCNYPHLRPAHADGIEECIPGMVSGGPNRFPCDPDAKILVPEGTPPMKCFADDVGCYSLNEITIYWNSPTVFVLAFFNK